MPRQKKSTPTLRRRPASAEEKREWATAMQFAFIEALPAVTGWSAEQCVFHGGTSLAMSWGSPRFSEDLDFLLNRAQADDPKRLNTLLNRVLVRMRESLALTHPGLEVALKNKTREGEALVHFQLVAQREGVLEHAMAKVEFWPVSDAYLKSIETELVYPARRGTLITRSSTEIPAATLNSAVADKLTALATRPHLKWRDLFDLNMLCARTHESAEDRTSRYLRHLTAYKTVDNATPREALALWLTRYGEEPGRSAVMAAAVTDLQPWLPAELWQTLKRTDGIKRILDGVCEELRQVIRVLDAGMDAPSPPSPGFHA